MSSTDESARARAFGLLRKQQDLVSSIAQQPFNLLGSIGAPGDHRCAAERRRGAIGGRLPNCGIDVRTDRGLHARGKLDEERMMASSRARPSVVATAVKLESGVGRMVSAARQV